MDVNSMQISESNTRNDLYKAFRGYLIFGRLLGVVPIQNLQQRNANDLYIKRISLGVLFSLFAIALSILWVSGAAVELFTTKKNNVREIAESASPAIYGLIGVLIFSYFLLNAKTLIKLFQKWNGVSFYFCKEDESLPKDIAIVTAIMFSFGVTENVIIQLLQFPVFTRADGTIQFFNLSKNASALEVFFYREYPFMKTVLNYNPCLTILLFLCNKLIIYSWNYTDILIVLVSRAFYYQYHSLIEIGRMNSKKHFHDPTMWKSLVLDHNKLSEIFEEFQNFFSPLIFLSYTMNTYYSCLQFHGLLIPSNEQTLGRSIFAACAFGQLMMRVLVITISAARVNENARGILMVLQNCPPECYKSEVERTERSIQYGRQLSFHGMECFHVTKSLYLSFLSVLLTFEIVLLQATMSSASGSTCQM